MADKLTAAWELRDSENADGETNNIDGRTADDGLDNRKRPALAQPVQVTQEGTGDAHDNIGQDGTGFGEEGAVAAEDTATILRRSSRRAIPSETSIAATTTKTAAEKMIRHQCRHSNSKIRRQEAWGKERRVSRRHRYRRGGRQVRQRLRRGLVVYR